MLILHGSKFYLLYLNHFSYPKIHVSLKLSPNISFAIMLILKLPPDLFLFVFYGSFCILFKHKKIIAHIF